MFLGWVRLDRQRNRVDRWPWVLDNINLRKRNLEMWSGDAFCPLDYNRNLGGLERIVLNIRVTAWCLPKSFRESFHDSFKELQRTVWHWVTLTEGGQSNIKTKSIVFSRSVTECTRSLYIKQFLDTAIYYYPDFWYISNNEEPGQFR